MLVVSVTVVTIGDWLSLCLALKGQPSLQVLSLQACYMAYAATQDDVSVSSPSWQLLSLVHTQLRPQPGRLSVWGHT
jgi:hypothetical protein